MSRVTRRHNNRRGARRRGRLALPATVRRVGWGVLALAMLAAAGTALLRWANQPIERLIVTGTLQHVSARQVEQVVRAHLTGAGLVTVNLVAISQGLAALPWVDSATVQRSWPRGLTISIVEQTAVARWDNSGLVNGRGELFLPAAAYLPPELPNLNGPDGAEQEVTTRYLAMQGQLTEMGLRLTSLTLDARGDWSFALDDGVRVRLGRMHVASRFERFVQAAAALVRARAADIAYVDMRYGNGFAVGWKDSVAPLAKSGEHPHFNG